MSNTSTPELIYAVLCRRVIEDRRSGAVSLIDIVDNIYLDDSKESGMPEEGIELALNSTLVTSWNNADNPQKEKMGFRIEVLDPNLRQLGNLTQFVEVEPHSTPRFNVEFQSIKLQVSGRHEIKVMSQATESDEWQVCTILPFNVKFVSTNKPT